MITNLSFSFLCWLHSGTQIQMIDRQYFATSIYGEKFIGHDYKFKVGDQEFDRYYQAEQYQHKNFCPEVKI